MRTSDLYALLFALYQKQFLDVDEAAKQLGVCEQTVRNQLARGDFPVKSITLGDRRLIPLAALAEFVATAAGLAPDPAPLIPQALAYPAAHNARPTTRKNKPGAGRPSREQNEAARAAGYKGWAEYRRAMAAAS